LVEELEAGRQLVTVRRAPAIAASTASQAPPRGVRGSERERCRGAGRVVRQVAVAAADAVAHRPVVDEGLPLEEYTSPASLPRAVVITSASPT
jgi:hypothetical protein